MPTVRSPAAERFALRARRRARDAEMEVRRAYLRTMRDLSASLPQREMERMIGTGVAIATVLLTIDGLLPSALVPLRAALHRTVTRGALAFARDIPGSQRSAYVVSLLSTGALNSRVEEAIRTVDSVVTRRLAEGVRESVRAIIAQGYADGRGPRTIARDLHNLIGLSEAEIQQVANFRDALLGKNGRRWEDYERRDKRFDGTVRRAMEGGGLKPAQVERMTDAYAKRRLALSNEANARTATVDAMKRAQRAAWQQAVGAGLVDGSRLMKEWIGINDGRERESHLIMNGSVVPFDAPFPNGDFLPGDADPWNCRCWPRYYEAREMA